MTVISIVGEVLGNRRLGTDDYLTLLDATGRVLRAGKGGAIPAELAPILARLDLQVEEWIATMLGWRQMRGSCVGGAQARTTEALRQGVQWVKNHCPLFLRDVAWDRVHIYAQSVIASLRVGATR